MVFLNLWFGDLRAHTNERMNGATPLHVVVRSPNLTKLNLLLEAGADPNLTADNGWTPIHPAIRGNQSQEIILALLKGGADRLPRPRKAERPGTWSETRRRTRILKLALAQ